MLCPYSSLDVLELVFDATVAQLVKGTDVRAPVLTHGASRARWC